MMDIEDMHPLRKRVQCGHILPCCRKCKPPKRTFTDQLRAAMMAEMKIKIPSSDKRLLDEPMLLLGFGINSYFDVIADLLKLFSWITLFMLPTMYIYAYNEQKALST